MDYINPENLTRKLPSCHAELDEVCISFYPTLNPELAKLTTNGVQQAARPGKASNKQAVPDRLDEHELALAG